MQVHFANPGGIETLDGEATEIADVTEITTLEDGTRHLVVPSSRHGYTEQTATVQTGKKTSTTIPRIGCFFQ